MLLAISRLNFNKFIVIIHEITPRVWAQYFCDGFVHRKAPGMAFDRFENTQMLERQNSIADDLLVTDVHDTIGMFLIFKFSWLPDSDK